MESTKIQYEINKKPSKSGRGVVFFVTVNGKRINGINYRVQKEAIFWFNKLVDQLGADKIIEWANS